MNTNDHIKSLLNKFILNQCSKEEIEEVIAYFQNIKESSELPSVEDVLKLLKDKPSMTSVEANRIHTNILKIAKQNRKETKQRLSYFLKYAVAILVIGILTASYLFKDNIFNKEIKTTPAIVNTNSIKIGTDKAILTLEDGSIVALEKGNTFNTHKVNSNGEEIVYKSGVGNTTEVVYNYLTIPRGGQFHVVLSDGTEVWLNSESQLKYPVNFVKGAVREVALVYGEAYFDVSPSTEHEGSKFKVINQSQEVEVLGTEFNIKAYKDETNIYTTLVEGKVVVDNGNTVQHLKPNQQSNFDIKNNNIEIKEVDVYEQISWKNGVFSFRSKPLKEIMKVISRWYDLDIIFENKDLESLKFKGNLDKNQSIEEVLLVMQSVTIIDYEIKDKIIILK